MATIKEIAKLAHVSTATVSNVLNGKAGAASAEKTAEITAIARQLNYTANVFARRLQQGKSDCIGVITEDLTVFNTPYIVDGIDAACKEYGYEMLLENMRFFKHFDIDFSDVEGRRTLCTERISSLLAKQVEGIIYVGNHCREISYVPEDIGVPFVYAYCYGTKGSHPSVLMDDENGGYEITKRLISHGHRTIGVICGPFSSYHTQKRLTGYQGALFDNRIFYNAKCVVYGDWSKEAGYRLAETLCKQDCTALFAFNDLMAVGAADWCREHNLVPGVDIAIFGFDDREVSRYCTPQISTATLPLYDIGYMCAQLVIKHEENTKDHILLPCRIQERGSSEFYHLKD